MSLIQELANEDLLNKALKGCRAVLEKELGIKNVLFSMSSNVRQEYMRRVREGKAGNATTEFPYSFLTLTALAGVKDRQNNYAAQRHGQRFQTTGLRATTTKGYLFPITLGLDFHYIDSDAARLLNLAQALVLLSITDGLSFKIKVGTILEFSVRLEIPLETTINVSEGNSPELPNASDLNVQFIMHTTIGFFRDVSAVNSGSPTMMVEVEGTSPFEVDI